MTGINIKVNAKASKPTVECGGYSVDALSEKERTSFGLTDAALVKACQKHFQLDYNLPDSYTKFRFDKVQRVLRPRSAKVLSVQTKPVIVANNKFVNRSSTAAKYNAGITQQVENTVSNSWSKGGEFSVAQEVSYTIFGLGGQTNFSYQSTWGKETTKSKTVTLGHNTGVEVELQPGKAVRAVLEANRGTMTVQVEYTASLEGYLTSVNHVPQAPINQGMLDIKKLQKAGGLKETIGSTEVIKIGFYADARNEVYDM